MPAPERTYSSESASGNPSVNTVTSVVVNSGDTKLIAVATTRDLTTGDRPVATMVRGAQSFVKAVSADNAYRQSAEIWYLDNPTVGTADVVTTLSGLCGFVGVGVGVWKGVASGTAESTATDTATAADPDAAVTATSGATGIVAAAWEGDDASVASLSGQTVFMSFDSSGRQRFGDYKATMTVGSNTLGYTHTSTQTALAAASFAAAATTTSAPPRRRNLAIAHLLRR